MKAVIRIYYCFTPCDLETPLPRCLRFKELVRCSRVGCFFRFGLMKQQVLQSYERVIDSNQSGSPARERFLRLLAEAAATSEQRNGAGFSGLKVRRANCGLMERKPEARPKTKRQIPDSAKPFPSFVTQRIRVLFSATSHPTRCWIYLLGTACRCARPDATDRSDGGPFIR